MTFQIDGKSSTEDEIKYRTIYFWPKSNQIYQDEIVYIWIKLIFVIHNCLQNLILFLYFAHNFASATFSLLLKLELQNVISPSVLHRFP